MLWNVRVAKAQSANASPPTPIGFSRLCRGAAPNPSIETERLTLTLDMGWLLSRDTCPGLRTCTPIKRDGVSGMRFTLHLVPELKPGNYTHLQENYHVQEITSVSAVGADRPRLQLRFVALLHRGQRRLRQWR